MDHLKNLDHTMKFKHLLYFCFCSLVTAGLVSCGPSAKDKEKNSEEFNAADDSLSQQIEEVVYNIPSPTEIPYLLQATGAEFNEALLNPRTKVDQYAARNDKAALNLGVYAADIGYLISYDKTQEAIDYLNSSKTLAENLSITGTFDTDLLQKFENNIQKKDSLTRLLDQTMKKTDSFLKDGNRNKLSALVITGSFVEGLYISTGLIASYPKNLLPDDKRNLVLTPLIRVVLEQKKSVAELLKMLSAVEQTEPVASITADLTALDKAYAALNIEEQIKNNKANLVLSDKNLLEITTIVTKIRKGITE